MKPTRLLNVLDGDQVPDRGLALETAYARIPRSSGNQPTARLCPHRKVSMIFVRRILEAAPGRRGGRVADCSADATRETAGHRNLGLGLTRGPGPMACPFCSAIARTRLDRGPKRCNRVSVG